MKDETLIQAEHIFLEKMRVAVAQALPLGYHGTLEGRVAAHAARTMVARLDAYVLGAPGPTVSWPADWWQAVKQRFAPDWFLRRWPVVVKKEQLWRVCPHTLEPGSKCLSYFVRGGE